MFCEKCGRPIPEGQQNCSFCNPPSQAPLHQAPQFQRAPMDLSEPAPQQKAYIPPVQEPIQKPLYQEPVQPAPQPVQQPSYVPPVQQPVYQAPVQQPAPQPAQQPAYQAPVQQPAPQPAYQAPVQRPAPQPAQQPAYQAPVQRPAPQPAQQPAFELNMPAEGRKPKKKSGGKIVLAVVALVLVAAIVLAAINWNSITRFLNRNFAEPVVYLQYVEKENAAVLANDITAAYDSAMAMYYPEGSSVDGVITLEAGDQLMTILSTALAQTGMNMDLTWVDSISLAPSVEIYENTMQVELGVGLNNTSVATVSAVWDMESQTVLVGIPELHSTFVEMDAADVFGQEAATIAQTMAMSRQISAAFMEAMPEGAQLESLINKYLGIIIDQLSEAEKANETVKAGGLEQDLLVITVELSQKDILNMLSAVLEEAKDDETIEEILDAFGDAMGEMGQPVDLYDAFSEAMDNGLENLEYMIDEAEKGTFLTIETFLDNQDTIVGRAFTVEMEGEELEAHYITVTEDGKFAFDAQAATLAVTGKGTVKDGKRSGSYTLSVEGTDYVTLELEDVATADQLSGTFRLIPEAAIYEMMDVDASVSGVLDQMALALTFGGDEIVVGLDMAGSNLFSFAISGESAKPRPISLPQGVSVDDDEGGMKWISELDVDAVISNLEKAGVPSQYMTIIEQYAEMFQEEFN